MRITTRQLRRIIREEASRALNEAGDSPADAAGVISVVKNIAALGVKLQGAGNQAAGMLHGYRNDPRFPDKLEEALTQIEDEFKELQAAVASLKREAWKVRGKQNIAATKAAGAGKDTVR